MKAARLVGPRQFEFFDVPTPTPGPGELLVRMECGSICGSDLRTYDHVYPEEQYPLDLGEPCHERVGVIEESRDDALRPGQRVIALSATESSGGLVEYMVVPAGRAVPVPETADPNLWVLCQPAGTVFYAVDQIGSVLGKRVVVLGQGPIGLIFTQMMLNLGASQVIVTDLLDYRLEAAKRLGATHAINAARDNVAEAVAEITGGAMADVAIDAVGRPESANQVFEVLRRMGKAAIFGLPHDEQVFPFDWGMMFSKAPTMVVTHVTAMGPSESPKWVRASIELIEQGRLDLSHLVTHRFSWDEVGRAYETYSAKQDESLKVIMSLSNGT